MHARKEFSLGRRFSKDESISPASPAKALL
jgi:hypothetical protein